MKHSQKWTAALGLAAAMTFTSVATADEAVVLLSDGRTLNAMTNLTQCPDQGAVVLSHAPDAFADLAETLDAGQGCPGSDAVATAGQSSQVTATSMHAMGNALASASSDTLGLIHAIPRSRFEVSFEVHETRNLVLDATLMAAGDHGAPVVAASSSVRLWQPNEPPMFEHVRSTASPGMVELEEVFALAPGIYTIRAEAMVIIDGGVPPDVSSAAAFFIDIDFVEPEVVGDLNGDGVVDVSDLLILLGAWGDCPRTGDCPADLNGDGVVDVSDLLILLSHWG